MHGRPRPPKGFEPTTEQREKLKKKTLLLKNATTDVLTRVQDRQYDAQTFATSAKLLSLNAEIYTAWNYRKDALTQATPSISHFQKSDMPCDDSCLVRKRRQKRRRGHCASKNLPSSRQLSPTCPRATVPGSIVVGWWGLACVTCKQSFALSRRN